MISCTQFIPLYSEFFKYLEKRGGHDAVVEYWHRISDDNLGDKTNPNSLISFIEKSDGFEGAINYWRHTLTEEACDLFQINDFERGYMLEDMRWCPSRGRLNSFKHVEPYYDYCEHCNVIYSRVLEKYGVVYERDHSKIDQAKCRGLLYREGNKPPYDLKNLTEADIEEMKNSPTAEIIDMSSDDNNYLHRDFHILGDFALYYCAEKFGDDAVVDFLSNYTKLFYAPEIEDTKKRGMIALEEWLKEIYKIEEASDVLSTELSGNELVVTISKSPVIDFMRSLGQEPSKYYIEETRTVYATIAEECGLGFELEYYNEDGGTKYRFYKK